MTATAEVPAAPLVVESTGPEETKRLAAALVPLSRAGDVVLLVGDLGAGKTTFTQGFGSALGVGEAITSPTFTLVRRYALGDDHPTGTLAASPRALVHVDLYRLESLGEIADLALDELIDAGGVLLVEWGDVAAGVLGADWLSVRFEIVDDERRRLTFDAAGSSWRARWAVLASALAAAERRSTADR